jgi:hypothetical protein
VQQGFWIPPVSIWTLFDTFVGYAGSLRLFELFFVVGLFVLLWHRNTIAGEFRRMASSDVHRYFLLVAWIVVPVIVPFIVSHYAPSIFSPKYTIPALAAFYLITARIISAIPSREAVIVIILIMLFFSIGSLREYYAVRTKEQWREATHYIEEQAHPGDLIIFNDGMCQKYGFDYYSRRSDVVKKPFNMPQITSANRTDEIKTTLGNSRRVWLVLAHSNEAGEVMRAELVHSLTRSDQRIWIGIETDLFERQ